MKPRLIAALLRLYPAAWRREYGPELQGVLEDRPLGARTIANVVWGGLRQRVRTGEPWAVMGLALLVVITVFLTKQILSPPPYWPGVERGVYWPANIVVMLVLMGCGCWTVLRHGGTLPRAGLQTMKMGLVANLPYFLVALLMWSGALGVIVIGAGDTPTTFAEHGFAITVYGTDGTSAFIFTPFGLVATHLANLVDCWIFGTIGGAVGRAIRHWPPPRIPV